MNIQNKRGLFCHSSCNFLNPIFTLEIPIPLTLPFHFFPTEKNSQKSRRKSKPCKRTKRCSFTLYLPLSSLDDLGWTNIAPIQNLARDPSFHLYVHLLQPVYYRWIFRTSFFFWRWGRGAVKKLLEVNQAKVILIQNPTTTSSEDCEILDYVRFFQNLRRASKTWESFFIQPHDHLNLFSFKCRSSQH